MQIKGLAAVALCTVLFSGCGGGDPRVDATAVSKVAASQGCINCHDDAKSPGTGASIVQEWQASTHSTHNGAGCADCHEPAADHPNDCNRCHGGGSSSGYDIAHNPDSLGKCLKCHGPAAHVAGDVMLALAPQHFGNMTASSGNTSYRASYVSSQYNGHCRRCHNPHNPGSALTVARQWARSAHANVKAGAYSNDFKTRGTSLPAATTFESYCVRCHTTTGYINFVSTGFADQHAWGVASDKTKEVTGCDACHDNGGGRAYNFGVRQVDPFKVYYNYSSSKTFPTVKISGVATQYPDFGASNMCMPCHGGRGIGSTIYAAAAKGLNFANANSPGAHYRAAGSVLSQKSGYEFQGRSYENASFRHPSIGIGNFRNTGSLGPCVACHMTSPSSHSFEVVSVDNRQGITDLSTSLCANCHDGAFQQRMTVSLLQADKAGFAASLAILNIVKAGKSTTTNWNNFSPGNGANTMGANFNYSLLVNEPGAFAHNALYTRRLIYDSLDWMKDGVMNDDVAAAINGATLPGTLNNPVTKVAYTAAEIAGLKQAAIAYLTVNGGRP